MSKPPIKFTYQDYLWLPEDKRWEVLGGDLAMVPAPSWSHQTILKRLFRILDEHVTARGLGEVMFAPLDVVLSEEDVVQPDLLYIARDRLAIVTHRGVEGPPDLVVEVLSEGTRERDRVIKRKLYAKYGVQEYWLVDPDAKTVEVLRLGESGYETEQVYPRTSTLRSPLLQDLALLLEALFP